MQANVIENRIADLLKLATEGELRSSATAIEVMNGTLSLLSALYGPQSLQLRTFAEATSPKGNDMLRGGYATSVMQIARGTLTNLRHDLKAGLTTNLYGQITGEVVTDFVRLAREVLSSDTSENAKNVSAVLAAAAFEDTLRRLATLRGIAHQEKLADLVTELKKDGALVGPQVGIAQAYLKFRNDALHANWNLIDRAAVSSVLGFVEEMLLKHFS